MDRDIEFKHVNFSYGTSGEVLHDIDLKIPAGTTLGILGSTGSGKSTLTYLLDRLYELPEGSGAITIALMMSISKPTICLSLFSNANGA